MKTQIMKDIQAEELKLQQAGRYTNQYKPMMAVVEIRNNPTVTGDLTGDIRVYREEKSSYRRNVSAKEGITYSKEEKDEVIALAREGFVSQEEAALILGCSKPTMKNILLPEEKSTLGLVEMLKGICSELSENDGKYNFQLNIHDNFDDFLVDIDCHIRNYTPSDEGNTMDGDNDNPYGEVKGVV